jgi:O-antigen/teichoic acid export membrane protein
VIKSVIKDALTYTVPAVLSRGIAIFLLPIYTRIADLGELGALDLSLAFGNIVALTVALEIHQAVGRFIPELSDAKLKIAYSSTGLGFTFLMYSLFGVIAYNYYFELNHLITGNSIFAEPFKLLLIYIFLYGIFSYSQNQLRFEGKSARYATVSIVYAVLNLLAAYVLGIVYDLGLVAIVYSMILSVLASLSLTLFFLRHSFSFVFRFDLLKALLKFSIPLIPSSVLVFVRHYLDRFLLREMIGIQSVGLYGVAIRLSMAASLVMYGFQMAISPLIYKHYNDPETPDNLSVIFKYFVVFSMLFFVIYSLSTQELLILFATPEFLTVSKIIPVLFVSFLLSNMYIFMPGIAIRKKTYLFFFVNLIAALINIVLNYLLIPYFGMFGAAIATLLGNFSAFICYAYLSQKLYFVNHNWFRYALIFIFSITLVVIYFVIGSYFEYIETLLLRVALIIILIGAMFYINLITRNDLLIVKRGAIKIMNR